MHRIVVHWPGLLALFFCMLCLSPAAARAEPCADLAKLSFDDGRVVAAERVGAGAFRPPGASPAPASYDSGLPRFDYLPPFCRVSAAFAGGLTIELWAPLENWSGEFVPLSGGLYGGPVVRYGELAGALMSGAAAVVGNSGVDPPPGVQPAAWLAEHPQAIAGIGEAVHRMIVRSKTVLQRFYGRPPDLTYMSDRAARDPLLIAQAWPEDLDAVAVSGAILNPTRHVIWQMWVYAATHERPESFIPPETYPALHEAVLRACDHLDGVRDGVVEDPLRCSFDPASAACNAEARVDCLTAAQVEAVRKILSPVRDARTGQVIFPGLPPGGELEWFEVAGTRPYPFAEQFFRTFVFKDPGRDFRTRPVNFGSDVDLADAPDLQGLNAASPDLGRFFARGGKLLLLAGWSDQRVTPLSVVRYAEAVRSRTGALADRGLRLFVVPGMLHYPLNGQRALDYAVDPTAALKAWARSGRPPERLTAARFLHGRAAGSRLVCAFPKAAVPRAHGARDDAASFTCRTPKGPRVATGGP